MTTQHTTGPWTTDGSARGGDLDIIAPSGRVALIDCESRGDFQSEAVLESNARLIAAAPDLLAVLQQANAWVSQYHGVNGHDAASRQMSNVIRAAIAKATGSAT